MISKLILSVVIAVVVTLGCMLIGAILVTLRVDIAVTVGNFLSKYAGVIGVLGGLWYFFTGGFNPKSA